MTITKILILSFDIEVEMQKLQEVKVEMVLSSLWSEIYMHNIKVKIPFIFEQLYRPASQLC
jgi:hypothetical protein